MKTCIFTIIALLMFISSEAQITVWPGDANNNGIVNHVDVLSLGLAHGFLGPARDSANQSIAWTAHNAPAWQLPTLGVDRAHMDSDGSGLIEASDTLAIYQNYDSTHGVVTPDPSSMIATGSGILLNLQQDSIVIAGSDTIFLDISLGSFLQPVDSIYGLAFTIGFDAAVVDAAFTNFSGGFLGNSSPLLKISRVDLVAGEIEVAISRTNHQTISGNGLIGSIGIVMDDNLRISQGFEMVIEVLDIYAINANGNPVPLAPTSDTLKYTVVNTNIPIEPTQLNIYPIPADNQFKISSKGETLGNIQIFNLHGTLVKFIEADGLHEIQVNVDHLPAGTYLIKGQLGKSIFRETMVIQKP